MSRRRTGRHDRALCGGQSAERAGGAGRAEKFTPAERQAIAAKGYKSATEAAGKIRDILADLWARRVWLQAEDGYVVPVDDDLAARVEEVLVRSKRTMERTRKMWKRPELAGPAADTRRGLGAILHGSGGWRKVEGNMEALLGIGGVLSWRCSAVSPGSKPDGGGG